MGKKKSDGDEEWRSFSVRHPSSVGCFPFPILHTVSGLNVISVHFRNHQIKDIRVSIRLEKEYIRPGRKKCLSMSSELNRL